MRDMAGPPPPPRPTSANPSYLALLNSLANDLDYMLSDLCPSPPLHHASHPHIRGDGFLEPYMEGLGGNDEESTRSHLSALSPLSAPTKTPSSPPPATIASLANQNQPNTPGMTSLDAQDNRRMSSASPTHFKIIDQVDEADDSCSRDSSGASSGEAGSSEEEEGPPCDIGLLERLIRTHPVWYLPGIQRAGAFHLLQGKEEGNFVVRQSSQSSTMAISVRLPAGKGPYIEHYLIQKDHDGNLSLESSDNKFHSIPALIAHYSQCCDELPVQLSLPRIIREAKNRQQLSSLALLGQEFWRYPMANPRPNANNNNLDSNPSSQAQDKPGLNSSLPSSQSSSLSSFGSGNNNGASRSPTGDPPDSIVLNLAPLNDPSQPTSLLSTFKGASPPLSDHLIGGSSPLAESPAPCSVPTFGTNVTNPAPRAPRPTPPNTLNLITSTLTSGSKSALNTPASHAKTPPPPPPRWSKPASNFVLTTTVTTTVSMTETSISPQSNHDVLMKPASLCDSESIPSITSATATLESVRPPSRDGRSIKSPASDILSPGLIRSPTSPFSPCESRMSDSKHVHRRSKRHKESRHYQESDILESPTVYCRSSVADKVSDYEDIWGPESLTTFKPVKSPFAPSPEEPPKPRPDILERVGVSTPSPPIPPPAIPCPAPRSSLTGLGSGIQHTNSPLSPSEPLTPTGQTPTNSKQTSPFYCEPADAIRNAAALEVARRRTTRLHKNNRHSDPPNLLQWPGVAAGGVLERIDSKEELSTAGLSSSVDNLAGLRRIGRRVGIAERAKVKPRVPRRPQAKKSYPEASWTVDSSWEFIGNNDDTSSEHEDSPEEALVPERKFPSLEQQQRDSDMSPVCKGITVQELIAERFPGIRLPADLSGSRSEAAKSDSSGHSGSRVSAYDNVTSHNRMNGVSTQSHVSDDDTQTIFSEPWDSSRWENLLEKCDDWRGGDDRGTISRRKSFKERLDPLLSAPRLAALARTREGGCGGASGGGAASIRAYALHLAADKSTVFAQNIDNFIACTKESREIRPQVVMRNMRQFMSGMKNYLVKHGEREFERQVERERGKLRANEFLNLDAILEGVMHKLVVRPLKEHLYRLFVEEYTESGAIQLLADNIHYARTKPPNELGIRPKIVPPSDEALDAICSYLNRLQEVDSPLEKLENLLACIAAIFNSVKVNDGGKGGSGGGVMLGADDFLPLFVWVLVQSGMVAAEIEAEYMWGLLHPSLLSGEGGYYLTTLSSAVHVLKNFRACSEENHNTITGAPLSLGPGPLADFRSVLKIVVPDEMNGSIITKTLPVRPNMTTRDVCKIIAHKVRITNPQDYGLFKLVDGEETLLAESECPQDVKGTSSNSGKHCMFAYKRIDAKIAWPRNTQ